MRDRLDTEVEKNRFRLRIDRGRRQAERGESCPHEEIENMIDGWLEEETLPSLKLAVARAYLEGLRDDSGTGSSSLDAFLDSVPEEDEEITEAEEAEIRVAEEDIRKNGRASHEEAMRFLAS